MELQGFKDILDSLKNKSFREKQLRTAGVISEYVKQTHNIDLIVVGGLSVEIYTEGGYSTQDIDFVGVGHEKIMSALLDLGFKRLGKDSLHEELKVYVEVPGSILEDSDEKYINQIITDDQFRLNVIGIEDIIKDRIRAYLHFKEYNQRDWIYQLIKRHLKNLDISYIEETLDFEEKAIFTEFLDLAKEVNLADDQHFKMTSFLEKNHIPYTITEGSIITIPARETYYGFTMTPYYMVYTYVDEEDKIFVPIRRKYLTLVELIEQLKKIPYKEVKDIRKIIDYLHQINHSQIK